MPLGTDPEPRPVSSSSSCARAVLTNSDTPNAANVAVKPIKEVCGRLQYIRNAFH
jgi:hypothetical protein